MIGQQKSIYYNTEYDIVFSPDVTQFYLFWILPSLTLRNPAHLTFTNDPSG